MSILSTLASLAPYHLVAYAILMGSTLYQSFIAGLIAFKTLPYENFSSLQSKVFPIYFSLQTLLSLFLLLSKPVDFEDISTTANVTLAIAFIGACSNLLILSPKTHQVMEARKRQEGIDGKSCKDPDPSPEMQALNKRFAKFHGVSVLFNMAAFLAQLFYGVVLADGLLNARK